MIQKQKIDNLIPIFDTLCMNANSEHKESSLWVKSSVANIVRYVPSGIYFARAKVGGKLIRQSLKTDKLSVAQLRLGDLLKEERTRVEARVETGKGRMTFGNALTVYRNQLEINASLKPNSKIYRQKCIEALIRSWPGLLEMDVRKISEHDCRHWAGDFSKEYSPGVFNNTVGTLRNVFDIAIAEGARYGNPSMPIKKMKIRQKELKLPERDQFLELVESVRHAGSRFSQGCANLIQFLAFGGFRKSEAASITWADCDFEKKEITVRGDPETGTKNWTIRHVPMIPDMFALLERLRKDRADEPATQPAMRVRECQKAIDSACKKLGIARFTHHDLRHLFATLCIESGVDIPTVSRWLGHKDGGALAMKVYGHLRDQHSVAMAQKVTFSTQTFPIDQTPPPLDKA
jgi:integrase